MSNSRNRGLMGDALHIIKSVPGLTMHGIQAELRKVRTADGNGFRYTPMPASSASSIISQLVKKGDAHYKTGGKSANDKPCFKVYPGNGGNMHGAAFGKRRRRRVSKGDEAVKRMESVKPTARADWKFDASKGVDVLMVISIGTHDTMTIKFEEARKLYQQLKGIFGA